MTDLLSELEAQSKWLRKAAAEIAAEGHAGWGNTCLQAAEVITAHHAELAAAVRDAERLEWLMHRVTGKELRRIGVNTGGRDWRVELDAAMAQEGEG